MEPEIGQLFQNPDTGSIFQRVEGGYLPIRLGNQPARGGQLTWLYKDGEGRTGPLMPYTTDRIYK